MQIRTRAPRPPWVVVLLPRRRGSSRSRSSRSRGSKGSGTRTSRASRRRGFKLDVESVSAEVARQVAERLGLDYYGLSPSDIRDLVADIVQGIAANRSTKPSIESLVKNIMRNKEAFLKGVAAKLVERGPPYSVEQLELIVSAAPEVAGRAAPMLYHEAKRLGADHIVEALRDLWNRYGRPTPIKCPRCGFNAVAPDLTCIVCGASLSEEEVKESIGFEGMLESFARRSPPQLVREALRAGYVVVDNEVKPPSLWRPGEYGIQLFLSRRERLLLERILRERASAP